MMSTLRNLRTFARRLRTSLDDRGDVPGWVLVTVMTAGLVTAIWLVADGQLTSVLDRAISSVSQP
jgi:3-hydroxyacyl-CoA dehydrogenase